MEDKIDIGRVIRRALGALGRNFPALFAVSLLLAGLPSFLVAYLGANGMLQGNQVDLLMPLFWVGILVWILIGFGLSGFVTRSTIRFLNGHGADIGGSLLATLRMLPLLIALGVLGTIMIGLGLLLLVVPGVIAYLILMPSVAVMMEEQSGPIEAIRRSRELTRGSRGRIFLLVLILWIIGWVLSMVLDTVFSAFSDSTELLNTTGAAVQAGLDTACNWLIFGAAGAALYLELREIREGTTSEGLAAIFD